MSAPGKTKRPPPVPAHVKYRTPTSRNGQEQENKLRPSEVLATLTQAGATSVRPEALPEGPRIVDFLDLQNTTTQTNSSVELDKPIFQPYPHILKFPQYEPFGVYEQILYFRNNDSVSRRIRLMPPDSPFFEVIGPRSPAGMRELEHSKIGPGMEVCFIVKFRPQEVKDYKVDLICVTEREKFLVPVHALGLQAVLNLPDAVDFGVCPVKSRNVKTILTQNVGTAVAKFTLSCTRPMFEASPVEGIVEVGQTIMIELSFTPQHSDRCEGDLVISYEDGDQVFMSLSGVSENVGVFLSTPAVQLDGAYISLSSQKTVKVQNKSEIPVKFSWKQFVNEHEEEAERQRLFHDLTTMQQLEEEALERDFELAQELEYGGGGDGDGGGGGGALAVFGTKNRASAGGEDEDLSGDEAGVPAVLREARAALNRKYRHLRRALEEDSMGFADGNFEIKPMTGEIWATSEIEVTVTFRPDTAADYACSVFLDVIGRDERLPLWLTGAGIGPKGLLSYDVLDIGDVFVNSTHSYELGIANKGDIPATWRLQKSSTPFGQRFKFAPSHGQLAVGASDSLGITFGSDILGEFSETFNIQLKGSDERLSCQIKGHVVGPTFSFDVDCIDFGLVSYSFSHTKTVAFTNTSDIDMCYNLSIPQDGAFVSKKEFTVSPTSGSLKPGETQYVVVVLMSTSVKTYDYFLTVDVAGVGKGLLSVPILADCRVPLVDVKCKELSFGECFVRYPYDLELTLVNTSSGEEGLDARFSVVPQEDATKVVAEFVAEPSEGVISANSQTSVRIRLVCVKLGSFRLPLLVTVAGSVLPPLQTTLTAEVCGPRLVISPSDVINWGNTDCLFDTPRLLSVTNDSDIPAPFRAFIKNARSKYRLDVREGVLAPRETSQLTITANLDDTISHKDSLHIIVTEGDNLVLPLVAKGTGTTMFCHEDLSVVDFGAKFTSFQFERKVTLENKGRRAQTLRWFNQTAQEAQVNAAASAKKRAIEEAQAKKSGKESASAAKEKAVAEAAAASAAMGEGEEGEEGGGGERGSKKAPKRRSKKQVEAEKQRVLEDEASLLIPTFTVHPAEIELRPRTAVTFTFKGYCTRSGLVAEKLVCESRVQGEQASAKAVFKTLAKAHFTNPLLEVATPQGPLDFTYTWSKLETEGQDLRQHKPLTLTNRTSLNVAFQLKVHAPFSLSASDWNLQPGEVADVSVTFDPSFKGDRQCLSLDSKVLVVYSDHPQRDQVPVVGQINYPNLAFDTTVVNFGSVLNDTTKTMCVRVKNTSTVPTEFWWSFIEDEEAARAGATSRRPYIPINQVYDILPIRSVLEPNQEEDVEFVYYGHPFRKFKGSCVCEVEGGPEYELTLLGEAATVGFKLDRSLIDFGKVLYSKREDKDFFIQNTTKVAFSFTVTVEAEDDRKGCVEVHPPNGTVQPSEKQRVAVRFKPGLPEHIHVVLRVQCAHFEPVCVPVYGEGIFPSVFVSLPRDETRQLTFTAPLPPGLPLPPPSLAPHGEEADAAAALDHHSASSSEASSAARSIISAVAEGNKHGGGGEALSGHDRSAAGGGSGDGSAAGQASKHLITPFGRATSWLETLELARQNLKRKEAAGDAYGGNRAPLSEDLYPPPPGCESQTFGALGGEETKRTGRSVNNLTARSAAAAAGGRRSSVGTARDSARSSGLSSRAGGRGASGGGSAKGTARKESDKSVGGASGGGGAGSKPLTKAQKEAAAETEANRLVLVDYINGKYAGREMPPPPAPPPAPEDEHNLHHLDSLGGDLIENDGTVMAMGAFGSADEAALNATPSNVPKLQLTNPRNSVSDAEKQQQRPSTADAAAAAASAKNGGRSGAGSKAGTARASAVTAGGASAATAGGGNDNKSTSATKAPKHKRGDPKEWVVAWHVCDFGNVVSGVTRKRVFRVTNTSSVGKLSFGFDAHVLDDTGFSVDPPTVLHLPEGEAETFTVTFHASKALALGQKEVLVALDLKNGPSSVVVLKANVTVPEVHMSADHLTFGQCWVGCSRTLFVQVVNKSPVKAEWDFKKAIGSNKDEGKFTIVPRAGVLQPGERQLVAVEYIPTEERTHTVKLPLKVAQSTKTRNLVLEGHGVTTKLLFDPPLVDLGPILPYSVEGAVGCVTLTNASDRPVEVYSLDFDKQYEADEVALRYMPGYGGADDLIRLPVRMPGQPLAAYVSEEYSKGLAAEKEAPSAADSGGNGVGSGEGIAFFDGGGRSSSGTNDDAAAHGDNEDGLSPATPRWDKDESARMVGLANDTVVVGPPSAGTSALAAGLAATYGYRLTTVDALVDEVLGTASALGRDTRIKLGRTTKGDAAFVVERIAQLRVQVGAQEVARAAALETMDAKAKKKAQAEEPPETDAAKELRLLEAIDIDTQPPPSLETGAAEEAAVALRATGSSSITENNASATPAAAAAAGGGGEGGGEATHAPSSSPAAALQRELTVEELTAVVKWRVDRTDCGRGIVLDSLSSKYLPKASEVAKAVAAALPDATLSELTFRNRSGYGRRLGSLYEAAQKTLDDLAADPSVPRDVFASSQEWASSEKRALALAQALQREVEELANLKASALAGGGRKRQSSRPTTPGNNALASSAGSRPASRQSARQSVSRPGTAGGGAGGGGDGEFSGPFVELDDFELGMLDDEALEKYHGARRHHLRGLVESARSAQLKVCAVWNPLVGLLPRSGDFHEAKEKAAAAALLAQADPLPAGMEGLDPPEELPDPEDPEEGGVAKTPYWAFADSVKAIRLAFSESAQDAAEGGDVGGGSVGGRSLKSAASGASRSLKGGGGGGGDDDDSASVTSETSHPAGPRPRVVTVEGVPEFAMAESLALLLDLVPRSTLNLPTPDDVPPPKTKQLVRRPPPRAPREPSAHFEILGPRLLPPVGAALGDTAAVAVAGDQNAAEDGGNVGSVEGEAAAAAATEVGDGEAVEEVEGSPAASADVAGAVVKEERGGGGGEAVEVGSGGVGALGATATRWVLAPHSSTEFNVRFTSQVTGKFNGALGFEVLGLPGRESQLLCSGSCEVPTINDDPRNVFMSRVKARSESAPPLPKRFVMSRNVYEFGPLLTWKSTACMAPPKGLPLGLNLNAPKLSKELDLHFGVGGEGANEALKAACQLHVATKKTNAETFRVSNNGQFDAKVKFDFEVSTNPSLSDMASGSSRDPTRDVFFVEPKEALLRVDETCDVTVWSMPETAERFHDTLVVCVDGNPLPTLFPVTAIGVSPSLSLHGPWERNDLGMLRASDDDSSVVSTTSSKPPASPKKKGKKGDAGDDAVEGPLIDFDRLLLGKAEDAEFSVTNDSFVSVQWRLDLSQCEQWLGKEFEVRPTQGLLAVGQSAAVKVFFTTADTESVFEFPITVRYTDAEAQSENWDDAAATDTVEAVGNRVFSTAVTVKAEAYQISAVAFEDSEGQALAGGKGGVVDFGSLRVGDTKAEAFTLKNKGKYPIDFDLAVRKAAVRELFTVEPSSGQIAPGATETVTVTFCSTREVALKDNKDIRCTISEPHTGGVAFETFNVVTSVRSHWARFKLQPSRGLAFGAVKFNEEARTRQFQVKNEGQFAFVFCVKDGGPEAEADEEADAAVRSATPRALLVGQEENEKRGGGASGEGTVAVSSGKKSVGRFSLEPSGGSVEPGETVLVELHFDPSGGPAVHKAVLAVLVSGADPMDSAAANARTFEVLGETCHPSINTVDFREVFEEQSVIPSLAQVLEQRAKAKEGSLAAGAGDGAGGGDGEGGVAAEANMRPCYCEQEVLFTYGAVVSSSHPKGVLERFKITNTNKIPCTVKFELSAAAADASASAAGDKGKGGAAAASGSEDLACFALAEGCGSAEIAPHEHFYVPVYFKPAEMRSYRCSFKAVVVDGESVPSASTLAFDLTGRGTLPCVTVEKPLVRSEAGEVLVDFGRVHAGRHRSRTLTLTNDGIVPATALFERPVSLVLASGGDNAAAVTEMPSVGSERSARTGRTGRDKGELFGCTASGTSITLQPGQRQCFRASFAPPEELAASEDGQSLLGANASSVRMTVMHNPYETTTFRLVGECYANDVLIEDLPAADSAVSAVAVAGGAEADESGGGGGASPGENVLNFGEYDLDHESGPKVVTFTLRNRTEEPVRFEWPETEGSSYSQFSVAPRVGHLAAGALCEVRASFQVAAAEEGKAAAITPVSAESVPLTLTTTRVRYLADEDDDADGLGLGASTKVVSDWVLGLRAPRVATSGEIEAAASDASPGARRVFLERGKHMIEEEVPEPKHEGTAPSTTQDLLCSAVADVARFECAVQQVPFAATSMFQSRSFVFQVTNPGSMSLPFRWGLEDAVKPGSALAITRSAMMSHNNAAAGGGGVPGSAPNANLAVPCPFTVEPAEGTIPAHSSKEFTVRFAPEEVEDFMYFLTARMPTLPSGSEPLKLMLRGKSTRPVAHVDLVDSPDYLSRRQPGKKNERGVVGPIEASTTVRCAELESRGTRVRNTKRFCVHNPTAQAYEFTWEAVGEPDPSWKCATPKGTIGAGRKGEMIFEYTPDTTGVAEAFFKLKIPSHGLEELFLFAGCVVEPQVFFDKTRVDFNALMVGTVNTERVHIENKEHLPFSFTFDRMSFGGADGARGGGKGSGSQGLRPVLEISPMSGLVPPNGRTAIDVTFCPGEEVFQNFNLVANVRRKPIALGLNVKGEGYAVHAHMIAGDATENDGGDLVLKEGEGGTTEVLELLPSPAVNHVEFGSMFLNESRTKRVVLANQGRFNFDYLWVRNKRASELGPMLEVKGAQLGGTVRKGDSVEVAWTFRPVNAEVDLEGCEFTCTVAGKLDYTVRLRGKGVKPALHFSFVKHDFGPCFTTPPGAPPVEELTTLRVTNQDPSQSLSLDCTFESTRALAVTCPPRVLEPGAFVEVPFKFTPRDQEDYSFRVPFLVNGSSSVVVAVTGQGTAARLELSNPSHVLCAFGALSEGNEATRALKVVNRSRKALVFELVDPAHLGSGKLEANDVWVNPLQPTSLQPREACVVEVRFAPRQRMGGFSEDLLVKYAGHERKLTTVTGSATGMAVALEQDTLPFGTVCSGSLMTRPLTLENSGDLVAQFRWQSTSFGPHFNVTPLEGRVLPGAEAVFQVTFSPQRVDHDLRSEGMRLFVDGSAPLLLTCLGACVPQPEDSITELAFSGRARRATLKTVTVSNPTAKPWFLTPVLTGDHWKCATQLQVPANGSAPFEVTYFPLCMTTAAIPAAAATTAVVAPVAAEGEEEVDDDAGSTTSAVKADKQKPPAAVDVEGASLEGSLFFALPTGSALMYKLKGTSSAPDAESTVEVTTPAKRVATVTLPLRNWLPKAQRFDVRIDLRGDTDGASTSFEGTQTVDLPAGMGASAGYALKVKAFKEGAPCGGTVTFTNPRTGEYMFHEVNVKVEVPTTTETIGLESALRQVARHLITVDNPLPRHAPVTFEGGEDKWWSCADPCVRLVRLGEMAGNKEGTFQVEYRPLALTPTKVKGGGSASVETLLEFRTLELGTFRYNLALTALPPTSEPSLRFDSPLGGSQTETFTFRSFNRQPLTYTCSVGKPAFFEVVGSTASSASTQLSAPACADWEGQELKVAVRFEPEALGGVEDVLVVQPSGSSAGNGGEYRVRLHGACRRPQPQGPFEVPVNGSKDVSVRNVFAQDREYVFTVDHPAFSVVNPRATIKAKEAANCSVRYAPTTAGGGGDTAKLFVNCPAAPDMPPWVFYLKGGPAK